MSAATLCSRVSLISGTAIAPQVDLIMIGP